MKGEQQTILHRFSETEQRVYAMIARGEGLKAREIAARLGLDRTEVNRLLVSSALMREMCYQDREYRWHALIRQQAPHEGLYEFSGWYGLAREFMAMEEGAWLEQLRADRPEPKRSAGADPLLSGLRADHAAALFGSGGHDERRVPGLGDRV